MKIAVFITRRDYEVVYSLLKGIHERAKQDNVDVVVFFCGETNNIHTPDSIGEFQIYGLAQLTDYDGAIIVAQQILFKEILEPLVDMVKKSGIPAVCIGKEIDGMMSVDIDNYQSMFNIVEHIMSVHNPETILYVEGLDGAENHLQTQAAKDAIHKYGKELTEDDIIREKYCYQDGFELAKEMYEKAGKQKLPKAIICSHDIVAHGIMDFFLYETDDVEIPDDILITGYNEQRDNRRHFYSLTTIGKPRTEMGYAACDLLLNKEYAGRMITKYFAGEMCLGKSCGCEKESESILQKRLESIYTYQMKKDSFQAMLEEKSNKLCASSCNEEFIKGLKEELPATRADGLYLMIEESLGEIDGKRHTGTCGTMPYILEVPIMWNHGEFSSLEEFESKDFLPDYKENHGDLYVAFSLHYQENVKGYCVLKNPWYMLENDFLMRFARTLNTSMEICNQKIRLVKINEKLNRLYVLDSLTGLLNRFGYEKEAGSLFQKNTMENKVSMVAFVDLDRLKYINDTFGHEFGDLAILSVTGIIKRVFPDNFVKVRLGGDEFVLFGECENEKMAEGYMKALRQEFAKSEGWDVLPFDISASIGYVLTDPTKDLPLAVYVEEADQKMYAEKMRRKALRKQALGEQAAEMDERMI